MSSLEDTLKDAEITEEIAQEFETLPSQLYTVGEHCYVFLGDT